MALIHVFPKKNDYSRSSKKILKIIPQILCAIQLYCIVIIIIIILIIIIIIIIIIVIIICLSTQLPNRTRSRRWSEVHGSLHVVPHPLLASPSTPLCIPPAKWSVPRSIDVRGHWSIHETRVEEHGNVPGASVVVMATTRG